MTFLHKPTPAELQQRLAAWQHTPLSYSHEGGVDSPPTEGFILDDHRVKLGTGPEVWQKACAALDAWVMFPPWAEIHGPGRHRQEVGTLVAMVIRICVVWWVNPARILCRYDSENTHGFVYGTLPEHAECGEERFGLEREADGSVWYVIRAFSHPRHLLAWLGFPLARWWQLRFVRDSQQCMLAAVR